MRLSRRLGPLAYLAAAVALTASTAASGSPASSPPPQPARTLPLPADYPQSYNPYTVAKSFLQHCKDGVYPVQKVLSLKGGGNAYVYDVAGVRTTDLVPPAGFDPLTASASQLAEYGYPPRPSGGQALKTWMMFMSKAHPAADPGYMITDTAAEFLHHPVNVTTVNNPI